MNPFQQAIKTEAACDRQYGTVTYRKYSGFRYKT